MDIDKKNFNEIKIDLITGIFLLILFLCGHFVSDTLNCSLHKLLKNNMYIKHLINILIVFFSINFVSKNKKSPFIILFYTLLIWFLFLLFSKTGLYFSLTIIILLFIILFLKQYVEYYNQIIVNNKNNSNENNTEIKKYESKIELLHKSINILLIIILIVLLTGFILYFIKQHKDHSKNFSYLIFFFGKPDCDSMK